MAERSPLNLSSVEVLALIRNRLPGELSAEQLSAVRAGLAENPALVAAAGGRAAVDQFLREAEEAIPAAELTAPNGAAADALAPAASHSGKLLWLLALAACIAVVASALVWQLTRSADIAPTTTVAQNAPQPENPSPPQPDPPRQNPPPDSSKESPQKIDAKKPIENENMEDKLAWHDWKIHKQPGAEATREWRWNLSDPTNARAEEVLRIGRQSVTLSFEEKMPAGQPWLILDISQAAPLPQAGSVTVRIDGQALAQFALPEVKSDPHYAVPLGPKLPEGARLEVEYAPSGKDDVVVLQRMEVVGDPKFGDTITTIVPPLTAGSQPLPAQAGTNTIVYFPTPYPLLEDEGTFQPADASIANGANLANGGACEMVTDNVYSGTAAAKVISGAFRLNLKQPLTIAEHPRQNEFRYLQFAVRANGGGRAVLELNHDAADARKARYDLGPGEPADGEAYHIYDQALPDGWILVTRDLFRDIGQVNATGLTLSKLEGGEARFDHVYLARTLDQFKQTPQPSAEPLAKIDQATAAGLASDTPERAIVSLEAGDRIATGTIVTEDGFILTAGHLVAGPTHHITAHFSDGTQSPCKVMCYRRDFNLGVVKLSGRPRYWPYLEMNVASMFGNKRHYRAFAYRYINYKPTDKPMAIQIPEHVPFGGRANIGNVQWELSCGGPLLEPGGTIVGINTGPDPRGGLGFLPIEYARDHWEQLSSGAPGGDWGQYARPVLGLGYKAIPNAKGLEITSIEPHWPSARCGLQVGDVIMQADGKEVNPFDLSIVVLKHEPGDTIKLTIRRPGEETDRNVSFALGRRP